jgi:DNA ligase
MKNREFVMLASELTDLHNIGQWFMSEKLDGMRAIWIPPTRGISKNQIAWANQDKDERYVKPPVATGLWTRYGNVIHAPDFVLDQLPDYPLDMELWMGRKNFQPLMSTVKSLVPSQTWKDVMCCILDSPTYDQIFAIGKINNPNFKKQITIADRMQGKILTDTPYFELRYEKLLKEIGLIGQNKFMNFGIHPQQRLYLNQQRAMEAATAKLLEISKLGGEGLVIKAPFSNWEPVRSKLMVKMKPAIDDEAKVIGYVFGDKRLEGMLGSLRVAWRDKVFDLGTGMTDMERIIIKKGKPGEVTYDQISDIFPLGTVVTFTYRELTDVGKPKEARYFRKRLKVE